MTYEYAESARTAQWAQNATNLLPNFQPSGLGLTCGGSARFSCHLGPWPLPVLGSSTWRLPGLKTTSPRCLSPPSYVTWRIRIDRHSIRNYSWRSAANNSTHSGVLAEIDVAARAIQDKNSRPFSASQLAMLLLQLANAPFAEALVCPACSVCPFSPQPPLGKLGPAAATCCVEATSPTTSDCRS